MADENDSKIHNIFKTDPLDLKKYVDCFVIIKLKNGTDLSGTVYTIDPVSESVVLITKTEKNRYSMHFILKESIKSMEVSPDVPKTQQNINLNELFLNKHITDSSGSKKSHTERKEKVKAWLLKNMIPVTEEGDILKMDSLQIHPPYGIEQCYCSNQIVLSRIQTLLSAMPLENT